MVEILPVPVAAQRDPHAVNMASLWIAGGGLHCSIKLGVFQGRADVDEPQAWGTILADLVRTVADALISDGSAKGSKEEVVHRIWSSFHEELSKPPAS